MRRVLAAVLLLAPAFTGCLDGSVVGQLREDLEAQDEYEGRVLLLERVKFTPAGIADPNGTVEDESDVSSRWNQTFTVPEQTRSVTATFAIDFSSAGSDTLPDAGPDGEVRVYVEAADGDTRNLTRNEPAEAGFDFPNPSAGEWTVGMEARGNGSVTFNVDAIVPVNAPRR